MASQRVPPVIDFSDFTSGDPVREKKCAEAIRHACVTQGFFQIINHTIPRDLQKKTFEQSAKFFSLPTEQKMKLDKSQNAYNRGYEVMNAQRWEGHSEPDLKEGYYVGRDLPMDHPQVAKQKFGLGPNIWPESLGDEFRETTMSYLNHCIQLAELVVQALAVSLGYDKHEFDDFCKDPMAFYKLLHYPPQPKLEDGKPRQQAFGAHKDFGIITLLLQGEVPGLQVWDPEVEDWYDVPPVEGAYVVNPGNLLEQWTNDVYISNVHRVIHNSPTDRYTIVFNYNGNPDYIIKCIESCREKPGDEKYAPIRVEDYIKGKYRGVYGRAGVYKVAGAEA